MTPKKLRLMRKKKLLVKRVKSAQRKLKLLQLTTVIKKLEPVVRMRMITRSLAPLAIKATIKTLAMPAVRVEMRHQKMKKLR